MTRWDDRRVSLLRKMWADGKSGGEIAERLGVSRSAVLGKVHRLGLLGRPGINNGNPGLRRKVPA